MRYFRLKHLLNVGILRIHQCFEILYFILKFFLPLTASICPIIFYVLLIRFKKQIISNELCSNFKNNTQMCIQSCNYHTFLLPAAYSRLRHSYLSLYKWSVHNPKNKNHNTKLHQNILNLRHDILTSLYKL